MPPFMFRFQLCVTSRQTRCRGSRRGEPPPEQVLYYWPRAIPLSAFSLSSQLDCDIFLRYELEKRLRSVYFLPQSSAASTMSGGSFDPALATSPLWNLIGGGKRDGEEKVCSLQPCQVKAPLTCSACQAAFYCSRLDKVFDKF